MTRDLYPKEYYLITVMYVSSHAKETRKALGVKPDHCTPPEPTVVILLKFYLPRHCNSMNNHLVWQTAFITFRPPENKPSIGLQENFLSLTCTSAGLKRNCLLRLDFSMVSISVTNTHPASLQANPIMAKFLRCSHPMAPAPT